MQWELNDHKGGGVRLKLRPSFLFDLNGISSTYCRLKTGISV